jgi:hypothetical protein
MRKSILFLIVLFSTVNIFSQNLSLLFKNDLPKDIRKYFSEESVNDILSNDGKLNPELIYWRINFLKELVENKNTNNDKNGLHHLNSLISQNKLEKNNFLEIIKQKAGEKVNDEYKRKINNLLDDYLENYSVDIKGKNTIPDFDSNKVYYVVLKYLRGDTELFYKKDEDYKNLVAGYKLKMTADLRQHLAETKLQQGKITSDYFDCLSNNWLLVKDNPDIMDSFSSAMVEYIDQKYSISKLGRFTITGGYSYKYQEEWFSYNFIYPNLSQVDHLSETKDYQSVILQADYKIYFKELISIFSYLDIGIAASTASSQDVEHGKFSYYNRYNYIDDNNYSAVYYAANNIKLTKEKNYSLYGKISIPVFVISPEIILHAGVLGRINYYSAELNYNYTLRDDKITYNYLSGYTTTFYQNLVNIPKTESVARHLFFISPIIELNYNVFRNIVFKFTTTGYDYFSINAGVVL